MNRRNFLKSGSLTASSLLFTSATSSSYASISGKELKPAILGGKPAYYGESVNWPIYDNREQTALINTLHSNNWGRLNGNTSAKFEKEYASFMNTEYALATASGTAALYTMLGALGIGPGDEVIIPVYTFVATYNVVVLNYALPRFVDIDIETFQIDPTKIEAAITPKTKAIMPVHIGGSPCNLDAIIAIGKKYNIPIIEDACQAHGAQWKGKGVGSFGLGGAFSFQSSKNLNCAEGGAITSQSKEFIDACYGFHNQGQQGSSTSFGTGAGVRGTNLRITEFQSNLLLAQMSRLNEQHKLRNENALYLSSMLKDIPGIIPAKLYEGTTSSAYHLYMFRYDKEGFAGMSREQFQKALSAEGVNTSVGYGQMNKTPYITDLALNRHYISLYGKKGMQEWIAKNECPQNDFLTSEQSLWLMQTQLLCSRSSMEQIVEAISKIQKTASKIKKI